MNRPTSDQREAARHATPDARSLVRQRWSHLLFLHWTVDRETLQAKLPAGLHADTYAGAGWLGLSAHAVSEARVAGLPALGRLSHFLTLNVSTCVFDEHGVPGLWFFLSDCNQPFASWVSRTLFALPARRSDLAAKFGDTSELYLTTPAGTDTFRWTTDNSPGQIASRGSLEIFLLERYHYYVVKSGRLHRGSVARSPFLWKKARIDELSAAPAAGAGFAGLSAVPQHACTVDPVDVRVLGRPVAL